MFLLPPVPGTPVYLGAGLLLTSKAQSWRTLTVTLTLTLTLILTLILILTPTLTLTKAESSWATKEYLEAKEVGLTSGWR